MGSDASTRNSLLLDLEAKGVIWGPRNVCKPIIKGYKAASSKHNYIDSIDMHSLDKRFSIEKSFVGWAFHFPKAAAMLK